MLKVIDNEKEFKEALKRIDETIGAEEGTPEFEEHRILIVLIEDYENRNYPIPEADPIELIKFKMDQLSMNRKDLEPAIGNRSTVSRVLNYKIPISKKAASRLSDLLNIPYELLLKPYKLRLIPEVYNLFSYTVYEGFATTMPIGCRRGANISGIKWLDSDFEDSIEVSLPKENANIAGGAIIIPKYTGVKRQQEQVYTDFKPDCDSKSLTKWLKPEEVN